MAYIDYSYYTNEFHGSDIPSDEFDKIAEIASMTVDAVSYCDIDLSESYMESVKKTVAYEADTIYAYGGASVANGTSDTSIGSESLGDYSYSLVSGGENSSSDIQMFHGIPISPITISILSKAGLRQRWAFAYHKGGDENA